MSHEALFWVPSFSCCTLMIFHLVYQKACNVDICADDTTLWKTGTDPTSIKHDLQSSLIKADHSWSLVLPPKQDYAKCKENKIVTSWNEAKDFSLCKSGPEPFIIFWRGTKIKQAVNEKILGVIPDKHLDWTTQTY